ncbi:MAG: LLM class flavin-dependent oxidoreductase [Acidimicrobiales bacterium]|nr:LLM class flavin-dependent oxidoreductase [Acidimicrobiales bacterium]
MVGVGMSLASTFGAAPAELQVERMLGRTRAGAAAGLDFLTVGDHHNTAHSYVQNTPIMGRLVCEWATDSNRPIGCLFLLPLWKPLLVAEHVGTLAAMHPGRFIVQTGIGWGEGQFRAMGAVFNRRAADLEESIRVISALFDGQTVSSQRLGITEASLAMRPQRSVEWWMGAGVDAALERVARCRASLYVSPGSLEKATDTMTRFARVCAERGHQPERVVARQDVIVADDEASANRLVNDLFDRGYRGMTPSDVTFGTVEQVAERFAELGRAGATDIAVRQLAVPEEQALRSIELLGHVRRLLA